jgi:MFS family permease
MVKINGILFYCSDLISGFAISMTLISLNWVILQKTQSSMHVSYLTITNILSSFIISIFGGILTDRYERKRILSCNYRTK